MILPKAKDALHKAWLYRTLSAISDNMILSNLLCFKGGTCAAMQGYLDRFSVDLDFDVVGEKKDILTIQKELEKIFLSLGLEIKDKSINAPQYFLKYINKNKERNTLKIDMTFPAVKANVYEKVRLVEIDRILNCETIETMFANKLVALIDRFEKNSSIAGRDLYDIHHFFTSGYNYNKNVILERRNIDDIKKFFIELKEFVNKNINQITIDQDLNVLLSQELFKSIRKNLKEEVLIFLNNQV